MKLRLNIIYRNGFNDIADREINISTQSYFQLALKSGQSVNIKKSTFLIIGKEIMASYQPISQ